MPVPAFAAAGQGWDVAVVRAAAGQSAFCRAEVADTDTPLTLAVALSPAGEVNLGIKVPDASFVRGEAYDVQLAIDTAWQKKAIAESVLPEMLLIRLGKDDAFMAALAKGKAFTLAGALDSAAFPLAGSSAAVKKLGECIGALLAEGDALPPPATLPPGLNALLDAAQIEIRPLPLPKDAPSMVDYAWTADIGGQQVDGGFAEQRIDQGMRLPELVDAQIKRYEKQCKGRVAHQREEIEKYIQLELQNVTIRCGNSPFGRDGGEVGVFIFYKTDTNIFATVMHRASDGAAKAAHAASDAVTSVLRRIAKEGEKQ